MPEDPGEVGFGGFGLALLGPFLLDFLRSLSRMAFTVVRATNPSPAAIPTGNKAPPVANVAAPAAAAIPTSPIPNPVFFSSKGAVSGGRC